MAFYYITSITIWLAATAVVRLGGQVVFAPGRQLAMALAFALAPPLLALLTRRLLARERQAVAKLTATFLLVLPAMALDVVSILAFTRVFPNLDPAMRGPFAAWLLWGYVSILVTGLLLAQPTRELVAAA